MANRRFRFTRILGDRPYTENVYYERFEIDHGVLKFFDQSRNLAAAYHNWTEVKEEEY